MAQAQPRRGRARHLKTNVDQTTIAARRVAAGKRNAAFSFGKDFLDRHRPPVRDARALLAEARKTAQESDRRVWVVQGGHVAGPASAWAAGWAIITQLSRRTT